MLALNGAGFAEYKVCEKEKTLNSAKRQTITQTLIYNQLHKYNNVLHYLLSYR